MIHPERIGVDTGNALPIEDAIRWAHAHGVRYLDVQIDLAPNGLETIPARAPGIRALLGETGVRLGLHTLSAVNVAEISPFVSDAVDAYLSAYVDAATATGAGWVIVHAGYHFTADHGRRVDAALARLERACRYAAADGVTLLLENTNPEPAQAEVNYIACALAEFRLLLDALSFPNLGFAFTANHAHLMPEGVAGFLEGLDFSRCREVRLADCRGTVEEHLRPGEGTLDFGTLFARLEALGFSGHYMNQFGTLQDMLAGRETLVATAHKAFAHPAAGPGSRRPPSSDGDR